MRIAVSYENGDIFAHVGNATEFKVFDVIGGKVTHTEVLASTGTGRSMVVNFLTEHSCDVLICNEICSGAKGAVMETGTKVYGAVTGNADEAVERFLRDELVDGDTVVCHHD